MKNKQQLIEIFNAGVNSVAGYQATKNALAAMPDYKPDYIISVGKAASGICTGALSKLSYPCPALVVTKYQHADQTLYSQPNVTLIEAAHPVPDENSLIAGNALLETITHLPAESNLLFLVSGGASSLAELLPDEMSLKQWQAQTDHMLRSGYDIAQINTERKATSLLKDGKLLAHFAGQDLQVLAISDVEGDDISVIGSGIGDISRLINHPKNQDISACVKLIGSNAVARQACAEQATSMGLKVRSNIENMYQDIEQLAPEIARQLLNAQPGVYIFGGEPTVRLPDDPGNGGRNQSLALSLAALIAGTEHIAILVAGTDGSDGPTDAAGGIINGQSAKNVAQVQHALAHADAGSYLRQSGDIFITGPTNTNVMDLVIAIVT